MKTIVFCSIKGGVGKSMLMMLTARATASAMLAAGKGRVLAIDLDSNCSVTFSVLRDSDFAKTFENGRHIAAALFSEDSGRLENYVMPTIYDNLDIIPGNPDIDRIKVTQNKLRNKLQNSDLTGYDYIFIDLPANYFDLHIMALAAADIIVTPVDNDKFNVRLLASLRRHLAEDISPDQLKKWKIFQNKKRSNDRKGEWLEHQLYESRNRRGEWLFKDNILTTSVPRTEILKICVDDRKTLTNRKIFENFYNAITSLTGEITGETITLTKGF